MKLAWRWAAFLVVLSLFVPTGLWAQGGATGAITGLVEDEKGGVIVGAKIVITNKATGQTAREVTSSGAGTFGIPLLPPGSYRLEISATGFAKFVVEDVAVRVTETTNVVATLKVGAITESVTVTAVAPTLNVSSAATGQTITSQTVANLPLSTGNFLTLLTLSAGANTELFDDASLGRGVVTINVNGQRPVNNNFQLEGINANDINLPILDNVPVPNPQTIQEFKAQTSLYDASQGRNGGGNIQVSLKSGTNAYHGDVYENFRNNVLNANDWFNNAAQVPRPVLRQNLFGASVGGPVPLAKGFFFFANYQGGRASSGVSVGTQFSTGIPALPTNRSAANLRAIFFPSGLPTSNICGVGGNQPCTGLDPVAVAFLNLAASKCSGFSDATFCIPSVGRPGITAGAVNAGSVTRAAIGKANDDQYVLTADKQITSKDKLSVRWFFDNSSTIQPFGGASSLAFARTIPGSNRFLKIGWTRTFSNKIVNEFRFGFNRFTFARVPDEPILLSDIGATRANSADFPAAYQIQIRSIAGAPSGGVFSLGTQVNDDRGGAFNTFVAGDDLSITWGKHLLRFGYESSRYQLNRFNRFATRGSVTFTNSAGLAAFQNFLLGRIQTTQGAAGFFTFHFRATDFAGYIQDDWKMTPRFTVNLGLRWEGLSVAHEKDNFLSNFSGLQDGTTGIIHIIHPQQTAKVGTPGVSSCTLLDCLTSNFAPRVGFAWDVFGDHKTALRGGYGIYYQRTSNQPLLQTSGGLPFSQAISAAPFSVTLANPFPTIRPTSDFPLSQDQVVPKLISFNGTTGRPIFQSANGGPLSGFFFFPVRDFRPPYAQQWNLSLQRQLYKGWVLEVGYVGTHGARLIGTGRPLNAGQICTLARPCIIPPEIGASVTVPGGTPFVTKNADGSISITGSTAANINARVPAQYLGLANSRGFFQTQEGNSIYHGLQTTLSHQFSNGLYFQGAYTWSKAIDNSSGSIFGDELNGLTQYGDYFNSRANRSVADFDRRHRLVVSYNYELPFAKLFHVSNQGFGKIINGWAINGVTVFQSGSPITVFDSSAVTLQDTDEVNTTNFALRAPGATLSSANRSGSIQSRIGDYLNLSGFVPGGACVDNQNNVVPFSSPACTGFTAIGNVGRNTFRGPFQQTWDIAIAKTTKVTEKVSVDFRTDFFNVWNHPVFNNPAVSSLGGTTGNLGLVDISGGEGSSGIFSTANRARIIQFGLAVKF